MAQKTQRDKAFTSPELASNKQRRVNTDQKAPNLGYHGKMATPIRLNDLSDGIKLACAGDISKLILFPGKLKTYDSHILQRLLTFRKVSEDAVPARGSRYCAKWFHALSWIISLCGTSSSMDRKMLDSYIAEIYNEFTENFLLTSSDLAVNRIVAMNQVELASLLLFFSWSSRAARVLVEAGSCDTVINGLLTALGDRQKPPKVLSMAVACIAFIVDHHSAASRVLTSGNCSQLVRLLLSKCVYPNEQSKDGAFKNTELREEWEVALSRQGLSRILSIPLVKSHAVVWEEVNGFCRKWWVRLHQAAAVVLTARSTTLSGSQSSPVTVQPAVCYALDVLGDLLQISGSNFEVEVSRLCEELGMGGSKDRSATRPDSLLLNLACSTEGHSESGIAFLIHFISTISDPTAACGAARLVMQLMKLLREAHIHADAAGSNSHTFTNLKTQAGLCAYDFFTQTMECVHSLGQLMETSGLVSTSLTGHDSSETLIHRSLLLASEGERNKGSRTPLGEISNTASSSHRRGHDHFQSKMSRKKDPVYNILSDTQLSTMLLEPLLVSELYVLQECSTLARLRSHEVEDDSADRAATRERVSQWIGDAELRRGGMALINAMKILLQSLEHQQEWYNMELLDLGVNKSLLIMHRTREEPLDKTRIEDDGVVNYDGDSLSCPHIKSDRDCEEVARALASLLDVHRRTIEGVVQSVYNDDNSEVELHSCHCQECWCCSEDWIPAASTSSDIKLLIEKCAHFGNDGDDEMRASETYMRFAEPSDDDSMTMMEERPDTQQTDVDTMFRRLSMSGSNTCESIELPPPPPNDEHESVGVEEQEDKQSTTNSIHAPISEIVACASTQQTVSCKRTHTVDEIESVTLSASGTSAASKQEVMRLNAELSRLKMEAAKSNVEFEEQTRRLEVALEGVEKERTRVRELEEVVRRMEIDKEQQAARHTVVVEENARYIAELADIKILLAGCEKEKEQFEARCASTDQLLEEAWVKMKTLAHAEDAMRRSMEVSEGQLGKCRAEMVEAERKLVVLSGDLKASFAHAEALQREISSERGRVVGLERDLAQCREEAFERTTKEKALQAEASCLRNEVTGLTQQLADALDQNATFRIELEKEQEKVGKYRSHLTAEQCEVSRLKSDLASAEEVRGNEREAFQKQKHEIQRELYVLTEEAKRECDRLNNIISDLRNQKEAIQSDLSSEMARSCRLGKSLDKQTVICENLQTELTALQEAECVLIADLEAKKRECEDLHADLAKHKDLISYINKLSTEAEAKRNK